MPRSPSSANPSAPKETDQLAATPEELNLDSLAGVAAFHLRLAAEASQQAFNRQIEAIGPSVPYRIGHYTVLRLIANNPGVTQTAVSTAAGRDKSTLTPLLNDFVRRGLVRRETISSDRRSYALTLTPEGEAALAALAKASRAHGAELDRIIGPENKADFIRILRRIKEELG